MIKVLLLITFQFGVVYSAFSESSTDKWNSYKSRSLGLEFEFPTSWSVSEENESLRLRRLLREENRVIYISFNLQKGINPSKYEAEKWYKELEQKMLAKGVELPSMRISVTTLGGLPVVLRDREGSMGRSFTYFIARNSDILSVSYFLNDSINSEVKKILSTINFGR